MAATLDSAQVTQAAITAVFGTSYPDDELQVAEWLQAANPALGVSLSHRVGRFGILERENATLLNAMLRPLAERTVAAYRAAVPAPLFISQNDGTVMRAEQAADLPVFTIASGPTNSLRGAAMLTGLSDAIVFDVGGTTTDVGVLRGGYPQLAGIDLAVAGVRTNFRMPDLCSIGVGGGSLVDAGHRRGRTEQRGLPADRGRDGVRRRHADAHRRGRRGGAGGDRRPRARARRRPRPDRAGRRASARAFQRGCWRTSTTSAARCRWSWSAAAPRWSRISSPRSAAR